MKKPAALILISMLGISILTGCGGVSGKTHNTGDFSVFVPEGWEIMTFKDSAGQEVSNIVGLYKGDLDKASYGNAPAIQIQIYPEGKGFSGNNSRSRYKEVQDLAPFTVGDFTWEGFTYTAEPFRSDYKPTVAIIWTDIGPDKMQVGLWMDTESGKITFDDKDVQSILESFKPE